MASSKLRSHGRIMTPQRKWTQRIKNIKQLGKVKLLNEMIQLLIIRISVMRLDLLIRSTKKDQKLTISNRKMKEMKTRMKIELIDPIFNQIISKILIELFEIDIK